MKKIVKNILSILIAISVFVCTIPVNALSSGDFDYEIINGEAVITKYNGTATEKVTLTENEAEFDFGSIEFTKPGVYRYTIVEKEPENDEYLAGMSYSRALYRVVITVTDNGNGTLSASADIQQLYTDDATQLFEYDADNNIVMLEGYEGQDAIVFTNTYEAGSVTRVPVAEKIYKDYSGAKPLVSGECKRGFLLPN